MWIAQIDLGAVNNCVNICCGGGGGWGGGGGGGGGVSVGLREEDTDCESSKTTAGNTFNPDIILLC